MFPVLFGILILHKFLFFACIHALKALGLVPLVRGFLGLILCSLPLVFSVFQLFVLLVLLRRLGLPDGPVRRANGKQLHCEGRWPEGE